MSNDLKLTINIDGKQAEQVLKRLGVLGKETGDSVEKGGKRATSAWDTFKGVLGAQVFTSAFGKIKDAAVGAVGTIVDKTKEMETIKTQFATLTGSVGAAESVLKDLTDFAAKTPFELPGIASAGKQLLAFGIEANQLPDKLQKIGDVAAGSGASLQDVAMIYGQVGAAGKLTGERLLQFQERAIPIGAVLAKTMGVAESAVKDLVSSGAVDFATFEKAFASLSAKGGIFFEGMISQSKTLDGVISTMNDAFGLTAADIGQAFLPQMKEAALAVTTLVENNKELVKSFAIDAASAFASVVRGVGTALSETRVFVLEYGSAIQAGAVALAAGATAWGIYSASVAIAAAAQTGFNLAFLGNPVVLAIAAISAAVAAAVFYFDDLILAYLKLKVSSVDLLDSMGLASDSMLRSASAAQEEARALQETMRVKKEKKTLDVEEIEIQQKLAEAKTETARQAILASRSDALAARQAAEENIRISEDLEAKKTEVKTKGEEARSEVVSAVSKKNEELLKKHEEEIYNLELERQYRQEELRLTQLSEEDIQREEDLARLIEQLGREDGIRAAAQLKVLEGMKQTTTVQMEQQKIRAQIEIDALNHSLENAQREKDGLLSIEEEKIKRLQEMQDKRDAEERRKRKGQLDYFTHSKDLEAEWAEKTERQKLDTIGTAFGQAAQLRGRHGKIGQKAAIAEAVINTYRAATAAYAALAGIPVVGPVLGAAAAAAAIAVGQANVREIQSEKFATGGIVGGHSFAGDQKNIRVNSGELILNRAQQNSVASQMSSGDSGEIVSWLKQVVSAIREQRLIIGDDDIFDATSRSLKSGRSFA